MSSLLLQHVQDRIFLGKSALPRTQLYITKTPPSGSVLPPITSVVTPPGAWSLAAWADVYAPSFSGGTVAGAPLVGPVTHMAQPGDMIALGGSFSSAASFVTYSQTTAGNGLTTAAATRRCVANRALLTVSDSVAQNAMILTYAVVGGKYSSPAVLNRAETWWLNGSTTGSEYVLVGDTVSVYGRNLSKALNYVSGYDTSSPSTKCMIWLYNSLLGSGLSGVCLSINPYRATFAMPALWPTTTTAATLTFSTGSKGPFTVGAGLGYVPGLALTIWGSSGYMRGTVDTYSGTSLTVTITEVESGSSGSASPWTIEPEYDVDCYLHNGHGGNYGWSRKVTLHVSNRPALGINYDKLTVPVLAPNGTDDTVNINAAISSVGNNGPATIVLQSGTYRVASRITASAGFGKAIQLKGQGKSGAFATNIIPTTGFVPTSGEIISSNATSELRDLTIDSTGLVSGTITNATNATPIVITTLLPHGLATNDRVGIKSVGGNTAANLSWDVTVLSSTTFSLRTGQTDSIGNGAYTSGGTWTHDCCVRVPRMVNCTFKMRLPSILKGNLASAFFMTGSTMEGPLLELLNPSSAFINNNDFYGTDLADQLCIVWGGRSICLTNNTGQHFNPSGTNAEKGHGRIYVAQMANYGTQRNVYISGNTTPTPFNNPQADFGDGEVFFSETALCSASRAVTSATANTVTLAGAALSSGWANTRNAAIVGGLGEGQSRSITDVNGNTLTVDPPWDLIPDTTSKTNVVGCWANAVIYDNQVTGGNALSDGTDQGDSQGFILFAGASEFIADANTFTNMNYGYSEWAMGVSAALTIGVSPLFFNLVQNNSFPHCNHGVRTVVDPPLNGETGVMLGNIRRNNSFTSTVVTGWKLLAALLNTDMDGFQDCQFSGEKFGIVSPTSHTANTVLWDTVFTGSGVSGSVAKTNITVSEQGATAFNSFLS